ncbi:MULTISPECIES: ABC transporter permease subunit [unclassified Rhizobium]|uniref:amino acid ABC transporter permease n=1 Tax=unclassified Rhizobium TaxID=2613769 RepID=UPI0006F8E495|nr:MULTISPECIES: ABC transporter permease subunit [unclassified Rhizobium]KQV38369.1 amino acid ABC transporter permease [Rhizobium sp. Root1212]KRD31024.1 amino acid ABC transporter permease [Rhizobium sp. Root268]
MALLNDARYRALFYQWLAIGVIALIAWSMFSTASHNLAKNDIATGFSYLSRQAGFVISEAAISYEPTDTVARALLVGLANTVKVSLLAAVLGTILGLLVGIGRMSRNPLLQRLMLAYVEALRNVPLLLYLLFWYAMIINVLPPVRAALPLAPHVYLSNSGLVIPAVTFERGFELAFAALVIGIASALVIRHFALKRRLATGVSNHGALFALITALAPIALVVLLGGIAMTFDLPEKGRFRLTGGLQVKPEFVALMFGLALSVSANVAEIVRAGIQAVNKGQWEASMALGLPRRRTMRLVILPQALRLIIPPLTNTYLTVFKNSSLAIAIGYPDLVMVSNTVMNQTGQAMETIALFMGAYLGLSIAISLLMNWYNKHVALKER